MKEIVELLGQLGVVVPPKNVDGLAIRELCRAMFDIEAAEVEVDADGSRRVMLPTNSDQMVLTPDDSLVIVLHGGGRDDFDAPNGLVLARSTRKAAHQLVKLRLWQTVDAGLRSAAVIDRPSRPTTLEQWKGQNATELELLQRQIDVIGLAAEITHQFSALIFEPALLAPFDEREIPFRQAVATYYTADALRRMIIADTSKRLLRKSSSDPLQRQRYQAKKEKLYARIAELYGKACRHFSRAQAPLLATRARELAESCTVKAIRDAAGTGRGSFTALLTRTSSDAEDLRTKRFLEPADETLKNTVRSINGLQDKSMQATLERGFASHLVTLAKALKTSRDLASLLAKVRELEQVVTSESFIHRGKIEQYCGLVTRECRDPRGLSDAEGG